MHIELDDVGPIEHLDIPIPAGGGVVVLRGRNDIGKSEALKAVNALVTGNGTVEKRDGSTKGQISFGEAKITVSKVSRRTGPKLEVTAIDGTMTLADLVDPKLKDPERADAARVKALLTLAGAKPDISFFYPLLGGKNAFDESVGASSAESGDLIEMAGRVKRALEAASRKAADLAATFEGKAAGSREASAGYDASLDKPLPELQAALESCIRQQQFLESERSAATAAAKRNEQACAELSRLESAECVTVEAAAAEIEAVKADGRKAVSLVEECEAEVAAAQQRLIQAEAAVKIQTARLDNATKAHAAAVTHAKAIEACKAAINSAGKPEVPQERIDAAIQATLEARKAVEVAAVQATKREHREKAIESAKIAEEHRQNSERLRDAAIGTEEVLSSMVGTLSTGLVIERGRLIATQGNRKVPYGELSDGTRWKIAIDIGVEACRRNGIDHANALLVIPQVAWSELDPVNTDLIDKHARSKGVTILTAEATADETLHAVEYSK